MGLMFFNSQTRSCCTDSCEEPFNFNIDNQGRVTGRIFDVEWMGLHGSAPTVSQEFLPKAGGVARDLALVLPDGRRVEFLVSSTNGNIANGIVV